MREQQHPDVSAVAVTDVLAALGSPVRLEVVRRLSDGDEHLVGEFDLGVGKSTLSHHMKVLREAGVVRSRSEGTRCFNSLRPELDERFPGLVAAALRG